MAYVRLVPSGIAQVSERFCIHCASAGRRALHGQMVGTLLFEFVLYSGAGLAMQTDPESRYAHILRFHRCECV